jgi:DNA-directed RNA polymerase I, II, and III subunit RPABC2
MSDTEENDNIDNKDKKIILNQNDEDNADDDADADADDADADADAADDADDTDDDVDDAEDEDDDDVFDNLSINADDDKHLASDTLLNNFNINTNKFSNEDLEINDSNEFLQKFTDTQKINYIIENHQECLSIDMNEVYKLSIVIRNSNNIIVDKFHKTIPILSKYEKTRILGIRLKQLNNNSKPYIKVDENLLDNLIIANLELQQKKLPFIIVRPLSNNTFEYWNLQDLEIL